MGDLSRTIAVASSKGGVGKTSVVVNLARYFASIGVKILVVDLTSVGDVKHALGFAGCPEDDGGRSVYEAIMGKRLRVVQNAYPGIDWVPGGLWLNCLLPVKFSGDAFISGGIETRWRESLAGVASAYDLVFIDSPSSGGLLQELALVAARWVLAPVRDDASALWSLKDLSRSVGKAQGLNPELGWIGAVIFGQEGQAAQVWRSATYCAQQAGLPVLDSVIRHSASVSWSCMEVGQGVRSLLVNVSVSKRPAVVSCHSTPDFLGPKPLGLLADDYEALGKELAVRMAGYCLAEPGNWNHMVAEGGSSESLAADARGHKDFTLRKTSVSLPLYLIDLLQGCREDSRRALIFKAVGSCSEKLPKLVRKRRLAGRGETGSKLQDFTFRGKGKVVTKAWSFQVSEDDILYLDQLVNRAGARCRSEVIRVALHEYFRLE